MAMHTITAMFHSRTEAERAADTLRTNSSLNVANVRVLPDNDPAGTATGSTTADHSGESGGFMTSLRHFFMPEEDRYGYAEGLRRGDHMVAVDTDEAHGHQVIDILENAGAVDLDAEEARWRSEGWRGYEPSSSAVAGSGATMGSVPGNGASASAVNKGEPVGRTAPSPASAGTATPPAASMTGQSTQTATSNGGLAPATGATSSSHMQPRAEAAVTDERIPLAEETLRVGKRVVQQGRVRVRSYVVETPVSETVHLQNERVEVERRPVDRPVTGSEADPFRERVIEAIETREEPVIAKDVRVREELVLHKAVEERDETVRDTVRRTEIKEDRSDDVTDTRGPGADPKGTPSV